MTRAQKSQVREITVQLTDLKNRLNGIHWDLGEDIPIEKSIAIGKAVSKLQEAIQNLMRVM